ncbi:MAG: DNA repair protein RadC [Pirellulaceae bacterium]
MSKTVADQILDRKSKLAEVLCAVSSLENFDRQDIASLCKESKTRFVTNVLKQLTADSVIGLTCNDDESEPRYGWLMDPRQFDADRWIHDQLHGGTKVQSAPLEERPRERLLKNGVENLKNSELLAILIRSGRKGESAVQSGQRVAAHFQDFLEKLPDGSPAELRDVSSAVSQVAYCQIMAGVELGRRVAEAAAHRKPPPKINSTQAAVDFCARHFARLASDASQEEFHIVTLDTKLQPIQTHRITIGTLDASLVHPREVFRAAIRDSASSILLVHNHPSGDPTPSRQDREVTERLKESGKLLGIQVIDHVIVAQQETISLAEWS